MGAGASQGLETRPRRAYGTTSFPHDRDGPLDFLDLVTQVIDLRSFSNLWYWIVLAILWSSLSHWVLGVPFDMVMRARRGDAGSFDDMQALARINVNRILTLSARGGLFATAFVAFVLTSLAVLGWVYRVEFCQALFLLVFPMVVVGGMSIITATRLRQQEFAELIRTLRMHRLRVQLTGIMFIFLTAFWGMWVNLNGSVLGL